LGGGGGGGGVVPGGGGGGGGGVGGGRGVVIRSVAHATETFTAVKLTMRAHFPL